MDKIQYISPSSFYYWEKCPLQAVMSKVYSTYAIFPRHPDADLGSLIHKFYEKQSEWDIDSVNKFNAKWNEAIVEINKQYKEDNLQYNYYPIQWHSKYYALKKHFLCKKLIPIEKKDKVETNAQVQYLYEQWINNDIIGGKIDLLVKENGIIKQIIDFKTGNIYEKGDNKLQIKEIYKQQLALYCAVILKKQDFTPDIFIETINGKRVKIEIENEYIEALTNKVRLLKNKINSAIETDTTNLLSNCNLENCGHCSFRPYCEIYKSTLFNNKNGLNIDIKGRVTETKTNEITIETTNNYFVIKKIKHCDKYKLNKEYEIYNLYFPESEENYLYETINTVIRYAE